MKVSSFSRLILAVVVFLSTNMLVGQSKGKAKVYIKKTENGSTEEYSEEFELNNEQDIQEILKELGLLDELGQLKEGQTFELNIHKLDGDDYLKSYDLQFFPETQSCCSSKPMLGVMLKELDDVSDKGVEITEVIEDSGASNTDLQVGDVVVAIDGFEVHSIEDLVNHIQAKNVGDEVVLQISRDGRKKKVKSSLGAWQDEFSISELGQESMSFFNNNSFTFPNSEDFDILVDSDIFNMPRFNMGDSLGNANILWFDNAMKSVEKAFLGIAPSCELSDKSGVLLGSVIEGSAADKMGLLAGDRVLTFEGKEVNNFDALALEIAQIIPGKEVRMEIVRNGKNKKIKGEMGKREYSCCDDMNVFKDFKGMDELGNLFYDYQFNMDEGGLEALQENIKQDLAEAKEKLMDSAQDFLDNELYINLMTGEMKSDSEMNIRIEVTEVSDEDLELLSERQSGLSNINNLAVETISFYPNPSSGLIKLQFTLINDAPVEIVLFDQKGRVIFTESRFNFEGSYSNDIDISYQTDGIYFLQIIQNGKTYSKKIVKQS